MRIAVAGGTGLVGRHTVEVLRRAGHEPVVLARSRGIDLETGKGVDEALVGVSAVIDVTNFMAATNVAEAERMFGDATKHLLAAEQHAQVGHHVLLSIVNLDRVKGNPHMAGKRIQEKLVSSGPVPWTILRATQFHEFAGMVVDWMRKGNVAVIPPLLLQPIAAVDVAEVLAEIVVGAPQRRALDLAGPQPEDMVDMARRTLSARGAEMHLVPSWRSGLFGAEAAGEVMLPSPAARLASTTFDTWLETLRREPRSRAR